MNLEVVREMPSRRRLDKLHAGIGLAIGSGLCESASAAPPFSPTTPIGGTVSGVMWLAPGVGQTLQNSNTMISAWADNFGSGNGVAKSGTNLGLAYNTTAIGTTSLPTVGGTTNTADVFVGSNIATMMTGAVSAEYFMVLKCVNASTAFCPGWGGTAGTHNCLFTFTDNNIYDDFCSSARANFIPSPTTCVYSAVSDAASWTAYVNGTQAFTRASNTFTAVNAALNLFGQSGVSVNNTTVLGEIIVYKNTAAGGIGSTNRASVVTYLRTKWGI